MSFRILSLSVALLLFLSGCKSDKKIDANHADTASLVSPTVMCENGSIVVTAFADNEGTMPADLFRGSCNDSLLSVLLPEGNTPSRINVFLVDVDRMYDGLGCRILVDAGIGEDAGGMLMRQLDNSGVKPDEIDYICLTHLHPDHIGGLLRNGAAAFPKAQIYLSVDEFNAWADGGSMAKNNELWKQVLSCYADRINLFNDGDTLFGGVIVSHLAPGHTPGHTLYRIGRCLVVGDLIHSQDLQINNPCFSAKYDKDPKLAATTRQQWLQEIKSSNLYLCGMHCYDPFIDLNK